MVLPGGKYFFISEFGWGENWISDHTSVIDVRECSKLTVFFIFSLVFILQAHIFYWTKIFDFITKKVTPSKV